MGGTNIRKTKYELHNEGKGFWGFKKNIAEVTEPEVCNGLNCTMIMNCLANFKFSLSISPPSPPC